MYYNLKVEILPLGCRIQDYFNPRSDMKLGLNVQLATVKLQNDRGVICVKRSECIMNQTTYLLLISDIPIVIIL